MDCEDAAEAGGSGNAGVLQTLSGFAHKASALAHTDMAAHLSRVCFTYVPKGAFMYTYKHSGFLHK